MISHGNITSATLGVMVQTAEISKIQAVRLYNAIDLVSPNLSLATGMGYPRRASSILQRPSNLPLSRPFPNQFLQLPQTFDDRHSPEVEH